ncbi:MAG: hypothetical protein R3245_12110, partial [Kiloniellales bacterium]|nr:hypothetical protein [Kiloniellales bacterium]
MLQQSNIFRVLVILHSLISGKRANRFPSLFSARALLTVPAVVLTFLSAPLNAPNAQTNQDVNELERSAEEDKRLSEDLAAKAEALKAEVEDLRQEFQRVAQGLHKHEEMLHRAEKSLVDLEHRRSAAVRDLSDQRKRFYSALAGLERIALRPRAALLASSEPPVDTMRGALLLGASLPRIEERARNLKVLLANLDELHLSIEEERRTIGLAKLRLEQDLDLMDLVIAKKTKLLRLTQEERSNAEKRALQLAREAKDLRELIVLASKNLDPAIDPTAEVGTGTIFPVPRPAPRGERNGETQLAALTPAERSLADPSP